MSAPLIAAVPFRCATHFALFGECEVPAVLKPAK